MSCYRRCFQQLFRGLLNFPKCWLFVFGAHSFRSDSNWWYFFFLFIQETVGVFTVARYHTNTKYFMVRVHGDTTRGPGANPKTAQKVTMLALLSKQRLCQLNRFEANRSCFDRRNVFSEHKSQQASILLANSANKYTCSCAHTDTNIIT